MDLNSQLVETFFKFFRLLKEDMAYNSRFLRLTMLQLQALIYLKRTPNSQMSEIATYFQIEMPSATSLINTLSKLKLVERKTDKKDRRLVRISLTRAGLTLLTDAMKAQNEKMKKNLTYFSEEEKKTLLKVLQTITVKMEESHEK